jgi:hypothetical protein
MLRGFDESDKKKYTAVVLTKPGQKSSADTAVDPNSDVDAP